MRKIFLVFIGIILFVTMSVSILLSHISSTLSSKNLLDNTLEKSNFYDYFYDSLITLFVEDIVEKGYEMVETGQGKVKAMRYAYTGDLETEIWYDEKKRWVGMEFVGSDGSHIKYLCKNEIVPNFCVTCFDTLIFLMMIYISIFSTVFVNVLVIMLHVFLV